MHFVGRSFRVLRAAFC